MNMNQRRFSVLAAICTSAIVVHVNSVVNATPTQSAIIAQAGCPAGGLSRSQPPFRCVTPAMFSCLKQNNASREGSLDYRGGSSGDIVVKSNVAGTVALLGFRFDASSQTLDLNVKKRNLPVLDQQIWNGFKTTLAKCRRS